MIKIILQKNFDRVKAIAIGGMQLEINVQIGDLDKLLKTKLFLLIWI